MRSRRAPVVGGLKTQMFVSFGKEEPWMFSDQLVREKDPVGEQKHSRSGTGIGFEQAVQMLMRFELQGN
jgi:hypothetical protein